MNRNGFVWLLAFVTFVIGDLATTGVGMHVGLVESHPLYAGIPLGETLLAVAFVVKLLVLASFVALYRVVPSPTNVGIPVGLSVLGIIVTGWNAYLILLVV